jgi:acyl-coenzyme A synthetase/AMP-(fatty) acid ligase
VFGKPNSILGNMLFAHVKLNDTDLTEIQIKQILKDRLDNFQIPRRIKFVETLSLTRTGKLKRSL